MHRSVGINPDECSLVHTRVGYLEMIVGQCVLVKVNAVECKFFKD